MRSQLDQVAALVSQSANAVLAPTVWPAPRDIFGRPSSTEPSSPTRSKDFTTGQQSSKAQLTAQVKSLEAALAHLPDEPIFEDQRKSLAAKAAALKQEISETKPVGRRIDGARTALERAQKRRAEATRALQLAQDVARAAAEEVDKIAAELDELESALAKAPAVSIFGPPEVNPVEGLHKQLCAVLAHLKADPRIDPVLVRLAEENSSRLLQGFRATLSAAEESLQAGEEPLPVKARARVKTTPARAANVGRMLRMQARRRCVGKQSSKKRTLGDCFPSSLKASGGTLGGSQLAMATSDI